MVSLTDLALSGRVPLNGSSATHRVALRKAARPPGQATARGPLQCRVGPPVQLPLVQIRVNRTIKNYYFRGCLLAPLFGRWPEVCRSTLSVQLLRAQSDNSLPEACLTRERGARESRAGGPSRARALTRHVTQSEIRPTRSVQSAEGKGAAGRSSNPMFGKDRTNRKIERAVGPTFFHSAATCLHVPGAQNRHFKRSPAGSAGGPAYGTRSAAAKS